MKLKILFVLSICCITLSPISRAEYYMVYPMPYPQQVAFADCDGPKFISVERVQHRKHARYTHYKRSHYTISTYHMATCSTWGYVWVPTHCDSCCGTVCGHWEERYGVYYYPVMSENAYSDTFYSEARPVESDDEDSGPDYDRSTADDTSSNIGDDP